MDQGDLVFFSWVLHAHSLLITLCPTCSFKQNPCSLSTELSEVLLGYRALQTADSIAYLQFLLCSEVAGDWQLANNSGSFLDLRQQSNLQMLVFVVSGMYSSHSGLLKIVEMEWSCMYSFFPGALVTVHVGTLEGPFLGCLFTYNVWTCARIRFYV